MMTYARESTGPSAGTSILLASDSDHHGSTMHRMLREKGFAVDYAGDYSLVDSQLASRGFDMVLLEVTGEHAVEAAVNTALRLKRANAAQFVGYLADADLETSGLAGDAVFPRHASRLPEELRRFLAEEVEH